MKVPFSTWRPHPWHGLPVGPEPPALVSVFVEITPFDHVKYEIDKHSGYLRVDRPLYTSSRPPTVYGFVPRTLSADAVRDLMPGAMVGDGDPLDVCVVSTHPVMHPEVLLSARVVGGIPMLDSAEADDKIIAVLVGDAAWGKVRDVAELPEPIVDQLVHYFATYKQLRNPTGEVIIGDIYGRDRAEAVVAAAMADYVAAYGQ